MLYVFVSSSVNILEIIDLVRICTFRYPIFLFDGKKKIGIVSEDFLISISI